MCGIAGIMTPSPHQRSWFESIGSSMIKAINHRGPDSNGQQTINSHIHFAHARLSIHDLSPTGHQPMSSQSGRFTICFNGEIYNFLELRKDLLSSGHTFKGCSDTEVMLAAFEEWGVKSSLKRFSGMFAFALWDSRDKALYLARDRMGEKPLFYGATGNNFVFCSELKSLTHSGFTDLKTNSEVTYDLLTTGYIPTPFSIYKGIFKLLPGHYLKLYINDINEIKSPSYSPLSEATKFGPKPYWDKYSNYQDNLFTGSPNNATNHLEQLLTKTVSEQLIADVPVGTFLSGGIDSSIVTAIAQKVSTQPVKSFTIGFDVEEFNEAKFAREIASHLGTKHFERTVTANDALAIVEDLAKIYDEPFADPSQIPTILVSRFAKEHVTVCLSGDGGDELFSGYNRYHLGERAYQKITAIPLGLRHIIAQFILRPSPQSYDKLYSTVNKLIFSGKKQQASLGAKLHKLGHLLKLNDAASVYHYLLKINHHSFIHNSNSIIEPRIKHAFESNSNFSDTCLFIDQQNYLIDDNLTKVDRASMSCSLETRLPLLDKDIVEFSRQLPNKLKYNETTKWLLRQVLYRHVPQSLVDRPKMGFTTPLNHWLRSDLKDWSHDLLSQKSLEGYVDMRSVKDIWHKHQSGKHDFALALWPTLMFSQWLSLPNR